MFRFGSKKYRETELMKLALNWFLARTWFQNLFFGGNSRVKMNETSRRLAAVRAKPFVVICGCTGTGKTKLSIEMAQWLIASGKKAEIINADAMQVDINEINVFPL